MNYYRAYVEACKVLRAKYEQEAAVNLEKLSRFVKMMDCHGEDITKMINKLQELKQYLYQLEQKAQLA